jgi:hypothetical protein
MNNMNNMNNIQKRFLLFLGGCIPARLSLVLLAKYGNTFIHNLLGLIAITIGTGFLIIYFRFMGISRDVGVETGGDKIWWNHLRPIHALIYYFFAYNILIGDKKNAWKILLLDVILGLLSFLNFHLNNDSFSKLMK